MQVAKVAEQVMEVGKAPIMMPGKCASKLGNGKAWSAKVAGTPWITEFHGSRVGVWRERGYGGKGHKS
jgi:hypothetical protein